MPKTKGQPKIPRPQPQIIFFDMDVGNLKNIFSRNNVGRGPNIPISFKFTHRMGGPGEFEMTLFDVTGGQVEPYLFYSGGGGTIKFGYQGDEPLTTPDMPFFFEKIRPRFGPGNAFTIMLAGRTFSPLMYQTGQSTGTLDENLKTLEQRYKKQFSQFSRIKVVPPIDPASLQDVGKFDKDSTEKQEMQFCKQMSESDWNYLTRICKYARDAQGNSGYVPVARYVDDNLVEIGLEIPGIANIGTYKYSYPSREGNVITWTPDYDLTNVVRSGPQHVNGYNPISGNTKKHAMDYTSVGSADPHQAVPPDPMPLDGAIKNQDVTLKTDQKEDDAGRNSRYLNSIHNPDEVSKNAIRSRPMPTVSSMAGFNAYLHDFNMAKWSVMSGTLEIMGDPTIEPGMQVELEVFYPWNYDPESGTGTEPHYTRGTYMVWQAVHIISSSGYTTVLNLKRISAFDPPKLPSK